MLRVLTLSTLFPDATRPDFGIFVERQTQALAARPETAVRVVAPVGLPPCRLRCIRAIARSPRFLCTKTGVALRLIAPASSTFLP
jgi:hypothetical protein